MKSVLHVITRLIVGGAQENTIFSAELINPEKWKSSIYAGPQTGPEGSLIDLPRQKCIPLVLDRHLVREISPVHDIRSFLNLYRYIRKHKFSIVHTHSSKAGILGRWAAWLAGTPVIVHTVHGWGFHDQQNWFIRNFYIFLEKITLPITDKLIAVTDEDIGKGVDVGIGSRSRYSMIRSGIELDRFSTPKVSAQSMKDQLGIPADATVVGTVTRLSSQKAPWNFVAAADQIAKMRRNVHFVLVGDGPLRGEIQCMIDNKGLADRFHLTGIRRDVPELIGCFDIFALSSLWEGLPRVIPQAMAGGVPVVASAVNGNAEIIKNFVNGRLVPANDPDALGRAILELMEDPDLAERLRQSAKVTVHEYDVLKMVNDIDSLYSRLLSG